MDYYPFVKRQGVKIRSCPGKSVLCRGRRRCLTNGRADGFTFIELLIIVSIIGLLCGIAAPIWSDFTDQARVETAKEIIREIEAGINVYYYRYGTYPVTLGDAMIATPLDPWGNPYQYLSSTADPAFYNGHCRRDGRGVPLNDDFDLYSEGKDRYHPSPNSIVSLHGLDDVVRGRNGAWVGLGQDY